MSRLSKFIATLGPIGYLSAPGTMGTLATLPIVYCMSPLPLDYQFLGVLFFAIISFFIIHQALSFFHVADPSAIILDEVIGCLITFIGITMSLQSLVAGFMLFRLFDIVKPFGIKRIERLPGAFGIVLDDCVAGLFANILLHSLLA